MGILPLVPALSRKAPILFNQNKENKRQIFLVMENVQECEVKIKWYS
jgi:flagellar assembly factor FliW